MQEVRAAVIGTGVMGRKYAQMIAEGKAGALRLTAVVCRSAGAQQWAKDTLPDTVRVCSSAEALYDFGISGMMPLVDRIESLDSAFRDAEKNCFRAAVRLLRIVKAGMEVRG